MRILKKWKKLLEILSFYTCVPKTTIIWGTVPKIWSETFFVILNHFLPFQEGYIKILKKWKNHLEMSSFYTSAPKNTCLFWYGEWRQFLLFYPILNPNIKIWKNTWRYDMCVPQMKILMYGSWCIKFKKTKIFVLEILAFYNCVPQTTIRCSNCHFSFCTIYTSFTHWQ